MPSPGILERNPEGTASGGNGADRRTARLKVILMPQHQMRTALGLDDDVLTAARVLATAHQPGAVISELARQALVAPAPGSSLENRRSDHRNSLPLLPWKEEGAPVDLRFVNSLRDDLA